MRLTSVSALVGLGRSDSETFCQKGGASMTAQVNIQLDVMFDMSVRVNIDTLRLLLDR
jgi:hypothetical protein